MPTEHLLYEKHCARNNRNKYINIKDNHRLCGVYNEMERGSGVGCVCVCLEAYSTYYALGVELQQYFSSLWVFFVLVKGLRQIGKGTVGGGFGY